MANFCTNCGTKLGKDDNFCCNCGTKIDKPYIAQNLLKRMDDITEKSDAKEKEMMRREMEKNKMTNGGYCSFNCKHFYEEFLDSGGMIVGDFDSEGVVEYYCNLGHSVAIGNFCKDYE